MPEMVSATAVEMKVMATRPTKLQTTDIMIASSMSIERVPTTSAMAFAASVAPLTKMVPKISTITRTRKGFEAKRPKNSERVIKCTLFHTCAKNRCAPVLSCLCKHPIRIA